MLLNDVGIICGGVWYDFFICVFIGKFLFYVFKNKSEVLKRIGDKDLEIGMK